MSEDKIRCRLCNQEFERISSHLPRAHGIYISEYLQMFPDAPTISEGLRRRFSTSHEGLRDSEETKQRKSESIHAALSTKESILRRLFSKRQPLSEETKQKISIANKGRLHTEEAKRAISIAHTGMKLSEEAKQKLSDANRGRVFDEDFGRRVSEGKMGHTTSEETRQKISQSLTGRTASEETKRKISQSLMGHKVNDETSRRMSESILKAFTPEVRRRMSQSHIGIKLSEETRKKISESLAPNAEERGKKISEALMGNTNALGHTLNEGAKRAIGEASTKANTGKKMSSESIKKMSVARKELWKNPEYARSVFRAVNRRPNETELRLLDTLDKHQPNEWKYVGDGKGEENWFGGRNPDFINMNGKRQVIEVFGTYWHDPILFPDRPTEEELVAHYKKYGLDCLVIREYDVWNETSTLKKLSEFAKTIE